MHASTKEGNAFKSVSQMPLKRTAGGLTPVSESSKYIIGHLGTVDLDDAALRKEVKK